MIGAGCLSSDWLLTESLSGIQSIRETGMIMAFIFVFLHYMFTAIIITHAICPVKEKKISRYIYFIFSRSRI